MKDADFFDLDAVRGDGDALHHAALPPSTRRPRRKGREPFLTGPIPWQWITRAGSLPSSALQVGLVLWREAKMKRNRTVHFCLKHLSVFGKSHQIARRGLWALEAAKLVSIREDSGMCHDVTILDLPSE